MLCPTGGPSSPQRRAVDRRRRGQEAPKAYEGGQRQHRRRVFRREPQEVFAVVHRTPPEHGLDRRDMNPGVTLAVTARQVSRSLPQALRACSSVPKTPASVQALPGWRHCGASGLRPEPTGRAQSCRYAWPAHGVEREPESYSPARGRAVSFWTSRRDSFHRVRNGDSAHAGNRLPGGGLAPRFVVAHDANRRQTQRGLAPGVALPS